MYAGRRNPYWETTVAAQEAARDMWETHGDQGAETRLIEESIERLVALEDQWLTRRQAAEREADEASRDAIIELLRDRLGAVVIDA